LTHKILVVDDDNDLREMVGLVLSSAGYQPVYVADGALAFEVFQRENPDLVLLDIMLPSKDGIQVCREIRAVSGVPIIMLTAKSDTDDVVRGLEVGADDYITKPHRGAELIARIRARLRPLSSETGVLQIGPLVLDVEAHEVRRGDELISLTPLEFSLLLTLAARPKQVFTREMLLEQVWDYQLKPDARYKPDTRLVNVHVQRLRAKVEQDPDNPKIVLTVRGIGYRAGAESS
jgi:two-component system response regulator MtrA